MVNYRDNRRGCEVGTLTHNETAWFGLEECLGEELLSCLPRVTLSKNSQKPQQD
ncbi:MAG: hypothetical protein OJF51_001749 [Nitrospira sp.]|jgi:hypothetical protein|nr:MAG: hypothetical protein OJF51_001749 [Nitrospira sp.]